MNRQLSGALAWGGLALLISAPSAEIAFKGHNGEAQAAETAAPAWAAPEQGVTQKPSDPGSYNIPLPKNLTGVKAPTAAATPTPAPDFKVPDGKLKLPEVPPAGLSGPVKVAETAKPLSPDYKPIPLPFRVVGNAADVRVATAEKPVRVVPLYSSEPHKMDPVNTASIPADIVNAPSKTNAKPAAPQQQAATPAPKIEAAPKAEAAPRMAVASANPYSQDIGTAMQKPEEIPFPAPASQRPATPVWVRSADAGTYDRAGDNLSRDVRQSIENIRRARAGAAPVPDEPAFSASSDGFDNGYGSDGFGADGYDTYAGYPDSSAPLDVYPDDPYYGGYDPYNDHPSRVIIREERRQPAPRGRRYVEVWQAGSGWEPIYPAVRDGGIRLDLTR